MTLKAALFFTSTLIFLTSCGGGSGGNNRSGNGQSTPTTTPTTTPTATPTTTPSPDTALFSLGGEVSIAANIDDDSDVNDPFTALTNNSSQNTAQAIENITVIQGFVTETPVTPVNGGVPDAFANISDRFDFYTTALQANQVIRLQVVNFDQFDVNSRFNGDIDIALFIESSNELVTTSQSVTEFEQIVVPADDNYIIMVQAFEGASRYVLELSPPQTTSSIAANPHHSVSTNFIPNEAIVKFEHNVKSLSTRYSALAQTAAPNRANLFKLNSPTLLAASSAAPLSSGSSASTFEQELNAKNPEAYQKYKTLQTLKQLNKDPGVAYASPNYIRKPLLRPNDTFFNFQWHYDSINLPQAWDITTGDSDVVVAVVDTGIVLSHPDLSSQLTNDGYDFISSADNALDGDGIDDNPDDVGDSQLAGQSSWHGTHVAGTIAAHTNNNSGVAGIAWESKIMPLRALGRQGGSSFDIIESVRYAAGMANSSGELPDTPAAIINLSLGGPGFSAAESDVYQSLFNQGVIIVAAAGNENTSELSYPASYPGVFSVSATDFLNNRAPYSNFGTEIDIAAPGGNVSADRNGDGQPDGVLSPLIDDSSGSRQPIYSFYHGTSMAAPHVAGVFALMKAVHPALTASNIDTMLRNGELTNEAGPAGRDNTFGHGIIDALKSVQAALRLANGGELPDIPAAMVVTPSQVSLTTSSTQTITLSNRGGENPSVMEIVPSDSWLTATPNSVNTEGLGTYNLNIDRTGLLDGTYTGSLEFRFVGAPSITVNVSMTVGAVERAGEVAQLFAILIAAETNEVLQTVLTTDTGNNQLTYQFTDVAAGDYRVLIGTDVDNDTIICQTGEACGGYPTVNSLETITVNENLSNFNMTVDIVNGFTQIGTSQAGSNDNQHSVIFTPQGEPLFKNGVKRTPVKVNKNQ